ncbi:MAG: energy transducer TonB [Pyrinomonadaceae bacterium]
MKRCPTCQEEVAEQFSFCPVDGTPLSNGHNASAVEAVTAGGLPSAQEGASAFLIDTDPVVTGGSAGPKTAGGTFASAVGINGAGGGAFVDGDEAETVSAGVPPSGGQHEREEFHLTFVSEEGLTSRLIKEIKEVGHDAELSWPEFKRDPWGSTKRGTRAYSTAAYKTFSQPNVAAGALASFAIIMAFVGLVVAYPNRCDIPGLRNFIKCEDLTAGDRIREDLELQSIVTDVPKEQPTPDEGTAGMAKGKGGGSKPKQEKPGGGGGGGRQEQKPASAGKLPVASLDVPQIRAPDPRPPTVKNPSLPVPASIVADPTLFPPDTRPLPYGDPKSKSTETSSGPGSGNGIGDGTGGGVGPGEGGGVGPGRGGNTGGGDRNDGGGGPGGGGGGTDYSRVFKTSEVTRKATILSKPEPQYTEEARKNSVTGEVTLRVVLSSSGQVTSITPQKRLPDGLTEKAIAAARQIRFTPAEKDGRPVSQYATIVYNFHIY